MSVRKPGVYRNDGHLDRETDEQQYKGCDLQRRTQAGREVLTVACSHPGEFNQIEAVFLPSGLKVQHQHGDEHQHTASECEQEKLDGCIFFPRTTPDTDEEIHR